MTKAFAGMQLVESGIVVKLLRLQILVNPLAVDQVPAVVEDVVLPEIGAEVRAVGAHASVDCHDIYHGSCAQRDGCQRCGVTDPACRTGGNDAHEVCSALVVNKQAPLREVLRNQLLLPSAATIGAGVHKDDLPSRILEAVEEGHRWTIGNAHGPHIVEKVVVGIFPTKHDHQRCTCIHRARGGCVNHRAVPGAGRRSSRPIPSVCGVRRLVVARGELVLQQTWPAPLRI
mmetsp:Transcript_13822/g.31891  ORF Transcript_13822/g.31891 Transcript_13822/m.31891 type:complete len:230 (+) Transcript_13822:1961-2650(+)